MMGGGNFNTEGLVNPAPVYDSGKVEIVGTKEPKPSHKMLKNEKRQR
jgi:hypothetical protein